MVFDPCLHHMAQLLIDAAKLRRKELGMPEEKNITVLHNEMAVLLGRQAINPQMNSRVADHLPRPDEGFQVPTKQCPKCGKVAPLSSICQSCKDAENGKYKSGYSCDERFGGCGLYFEKTGEWLTQRLSKMGVELPTGMKKDLGIGTITDEGVK